MTGVRAALLASSRLSVIVASIFTALAAWLSLGSLGYDPTNGARLGVLPVDWKHMALAAAVGLLVAAIGWRSGQGRRLGVVVSPLSLAVLPWLPWSVPVAFLIWTGPVLLLVWIAVSLGVLRLLMRGYSPTRAASVEQQRLIAGVLALAIFSTAAWLASSAGPSGDEPHYLVITQSLLYDGDLQIYNNHVRGDYHAYYSGDLRPDFVREGRNGRIYSIHPPGLPALVLPAFALGGYAGVLVVLLLVAAVACALAWWLAWQVTGQFGAAWFGWAAVVLSAPYTLETFTVYPDGIGAAVVLSGVWAVLRADWERGQQHASRLPWLLHGLALATLPWLHTRFVLLAVPLAGVVLLRLRRNPEWLPKATALLAPLAVGAIFWFMFFVVLYGTPDPSAPYGAQVTTALAYLPNGIAGVLLDQGFGLFATAPVLLVAVAGLRRCRRLGLELSVAALPYVLAIGGYAMWWAGWSGPARFLVPLILPLAIPAACAWSITRSRPVRALFVAALLISACLTAVIVSVHDGALSRHGRNPTGRTAAPWLEWAERVVDLPSAFPAFVPQPSTPENVDTRRATTRAGLLVAGPWFVGAVLLVIALHRARHSPPHVIVATTTIGIAALAMSAMATVWWMTGAHPVGGVEAQLEPLRAVAAGGQLIVDLTHRERLSEAAFVHRSQLSISVRPRPFQPALARSGSSLATLSSIPAGDYELAVEADLGAGRVTTALEADSFAISSDALEDVRRGVRLRFPVDVATLFVRADDSARPRIRAVILRPLRLFRRGEKVWSAVARHGARFGTARAFFLDDGVFVEPSAFWVRGKREASVVIAPDRPTSSYSMSFRNAPVDNQITVESGRWREALALQPGEERRVDVPIDPSRGSAVVRIVSASGFRPSEIDSNSRDTRFLGVYVRLADHH